MLEDLLYLYKYALEDGDEKSIQRALNDLASVGMDKYTADMLVEDLV